MCNIAVMKMNSGRITKAVWQLWDGKDRGCSIREIEYLRPYYEKCYQIFMSRTHPKPDGQVIPMNVTRMVTFMLKDEDPSYFK